MSQSKFTYLFSALVQPHLVVLGQWVYVTFSCTFDFTHYPFDSHSCFLYITPSMDTSLTVIFNSIDLSDILSENVNSIHKSENRIAFDYELSPIESKETWKAKWNANVSTVGLHFKLRRNDYDRKRIYVQFHIPTGIFAILSHIGFFIDSSQVPGRIGSLITLYLISVNTYNSLDAPSNRGFSYVDFWFAGIQSTIIFGILEFGSILCFRKMMAFQHNRIDDSKLQHVDFCAFMFSFFSFSLFVGYYASINTFSE